MGILREISLKFREEAKPEQDFYISEQENWRGCLRGEEERSLELFLVETGRGEIMNNSNGSVATDHQGNGVKVSR